MSLDEDMWGQQSKVFNLSHIIQKDAKWWHRLFCKLHRHKWMNGLCWRCGVKR